MQVISEFDKEFSSFKMLAQSLQPEGKGEPQADTIPAKFDKACHVALKFRASQKQLLWDLMLSLLK